MKMFSPTIQKSRQVLIPTRAYRVSVVIPMYNAEKFIEECLESLSKQMLPQEDIEILCIDDGSTDKTISVCQKYQKGNPHLFLIRTPHKGVSHARNQGIMNAHGKYIAFLDSDDMLSAGTLKNVVTYFDEHYEETDTITYDTLYLHKEKYTESPRNTLIKQNQVLHLATVPYLSQSRINILVKNDKSLFFDETLSQYEDQKYLLDLCFRKGTMGYCKQGQYLYRQHTSGTVANKAHPYSFFDELISLFGSWLQSYEDTPYSSYVQGLVLYDLSWRLRSDRLFPYHYKGKKYQEAITKLKYLFDKIENRLIWGHPFLISPYKEYFLNQKIKKRPFCVIDYEKWHLCDYSGELVSSDSLVCVFQRIRIHKNKLFLMGFLKSPVLHFVEKPTMYSIINDHEREPLELYPSSWNYFETKALTNTYWGFTTEYDLEKTQKLFFYTEIEKKSFPLSYWFTDMNQISTKRGQYIHFGKKVSVQFLNNAFFIKRNDNLEIKKEKQAFLQVLRKKTFGHAVLATMAQNQNAGKKIWLYNDIEGIVDNAYYQFKHDFQMKDGVERYYILKENSLDLNAYFNDEEKKYIVHFKSRQHRMLFLCCEKIITSFSQIYFYIPFTLKALESFYHLLHFEVIYVQHGVMHAKVPFLYAKDRNCIDRIVVSTFFEKEHLVKELQYQEKDLIPVGMPRFDKLESLRSIPPENRILFAPTWRRYLVEQDVDHWYPRENFTDSEYYQAIQSVLNDIYFIAFLEKNNLFLDVKLHPIMMMYKEYFISSSQHIRLIDTLSIEKYKLCITDFSSYIYDFIYLDKPILFFVPDRDKFDAGLHSYRELYIPLEKHFGDYVENVPDMVSKIIEMYSNRFQIKPFYKEKYTHLFLKHGSNHTFTLYNIIKTI